MSTRTATISTQDRELVERAQNGAADAFEELMKAYERLVFKVALSFSGNRENALDLTQNVFIKAFRGIHHLTEESNFKAWLMRIAFNEGADWTRRHKRHAGHHHLELANEVPSSEPGPNASYQRSEQMKQMLQGLSRLRPRYRLAISLRYFHGLKIKEIAEVLDCSENMAKQLLFRGVRSLRTVVTEAGKGSIHRGPHDRATQESQQNRTTP